MFLFLAISFTNCTYQKNKSKEGINEPLSESFFKKFNNQEAKRALINRVLSKGDTLAYQELWDIYTYSGHSEEFLSISLNMANNFNYPQAYLDTYILLKTDIINDNNHNTNMLANYYLLKAHELKNSDSESLLKERFGNDVIPKSEEYWQNISK